MTEEKKKGLLGWVQDALAPKPPARNTAPLRSHSTSPLQGDRFQRGGTAGLPPKAPPAPLKKGEEAAESKKRMAFILAYLKNPEGDPSFKDRALVFRILTEERTYQQHRIVELQTKRRLLPLPSEDQEPTDPQEIESLRLAKEIEEAQTRQAQIYSIMKKLTGVRGKTGGTGFLNLPDGL